MRRRKPKKTDNETIEKALVLLLEFVKSHPEIEITLWYSAFISAFVDGHIRTGFSYEQICVVFDDIKKNFKSWFE